MIIMEYRPIEVKLISGKDLKDVNVFSTMDVYVVGSVSGDPRSMQQTAVDKDGGINPTWNHVMRFNVDESAARLNRLGLVFQIMSNRTLGDKEVGRVYVPLKELFDDVGVIEEHPNEEKVVVYQVQTSTGRFKGQLEFSYKFGEKFTYTFDQKLEASVLAIDQHGANNDMAFQTNEPYSMSSADSKLDDEPVMAYPPVPRSGSTGTDPRLVVEGNAPYSSYGAPPQNYPHPGTSTMDRSAPYGYGAPPQNYPYEGYGHGHGYGYGYNAYGYGGYPGHQPPPPPPPPNAHMGYDYGYPGGYGYPGQASTGFVQQPAKHHKKKGSKFGLGTAAGLGAGLLGGLLVGEMVEDVADAAIYDDVYDF
ncbi:protein SRC2-like [Silene latifolia]|uniref:protein SRC2-like n=1 Tax=Silene latifolia TaxID=37657 RepID=UPI003D783F51